MGTVSVGRDHSPKSMALRNHVTVTRPAAAVVAVSALMVLAYVAFRPDGETTILSTISGRPTPWSIPPVTIGAATAMVGLPLIAIALLLASTLWGPRVLRSGRPQRVLQVLVTSAAVLLLTTSAMSVAALGKEFSPPALVSDSLIRALPVALAAIAALICEKSGVINVAVEGQLLAGACAAAVVTSVSGSLLLGLAAAILASVVIGQVLAASAIVFRADHLIVGIVLTLFAIGLTSFFAVGILTSRPELNEPKVAGAVAVPVLSDVPVLGPIMFNTSPFLWAAIAAVLGVTFLFRSTRLGLRIRAVGESPKAADTVGLSVGRLRWTAVTLGAVVGGVAGAYFTIGSVPQFLPGMTAGKGFVGLAAVIVGNWSPLRAAAAALLFGVADAVQSTLAILEAPIPSALLLATPYVVTILFVALMRNRLQPPAAGGKFYVRD